MASAILRGLIPRCWTRIRAYCIVHLFTDATRTTGYGPRTEAAFQHFTATARLVLHDPAGALHLGVTRAQERTRPQSPTLATVDASGTQRRDRKRGPFRHERIHHSRTVGAGRGRVAKDQRRSPCGLGSSAPMRWPHGWPTLAVGRRVHFAAGNFSAMGLRAIANDMARLRAGPVLHHDAGSAQYRPTERWPTPRGSAEESRRRPPDPSPCTSTRPVCRRPLVVAALRSRSRTRS